MKRCLTLVALAGLLVLGPAFAVAQDPAQDPAQDHAQDHVQNTQGTDRPAPVQGDPTHPARDALPAAVPTDGELPGVQSGDDNAGDDDAGESSDETDPVAATDNNTAAQDTAAQDTAAQDTAAQDTATQDTATQDTATQDTATQDTAPAAVDAPIGHSPREATDLASVLSELFLERTERAEAAARRAAREARRADEHLREREAQPAVDTEPIEAANAPLRVVDSGGGIGGWSLPDPRVKTAGLVFLILLALMGVWALQRLREPLPERGLLPRMLGFTQLALRVLMVMMAIMIVSRLLPEWLRPALLLAMGAVALAVGAGTVFVLLPDVVGGLLLVTEGRIKAGLWIEGEGFRGTVLHVGPRVTILRIPNGTKLSIPNRRLVRSSIRAVSRRWHEVETELDVRLPGDAAQVRSAIIECVICSPFVPVQPELKVTRDPERPTRWRVHARLLDPAYEAAFSGQLLERVEDALRGLEPPSDGSQTQVAEGRAQ